MGRIIFALLVAYAAGAQAQDPILDAVEDDPIAGVDDAANEDARATGFFRSGDALLRRDQVNGLENRDPVDRVRLRVRVGGDYLGDTLDAGFAVEGVAASNGNDDNRRNNDNERADDANVDRAYVRWRAGEATALTFGKTPMPLELSPLTWDDDLRPVGASFEHSTSIRDYDRLAFAGGYFAGDHLYGDDSRIAALQAGWHWNEGAPMSFSAWLTWLDFDSLGTLARQGLSRTNRRVGTRLVSDYSLVDAQLAFRADAGGIPLELRADLVRNVDAADPDEGDGARVSAVFGRADRAGGFEVGLAYERIQRDAVMAAFNDDDWWFHSAMRGFMPWIAYGITDRVSVRAAGFFERRDDQVDDVERLLVDVRATF